MRLASAFFLSFALIAASASACRSSSGKSTASATTSMSGQPTSSSKTATLAAGGSLTAEVPSTATGSSEEVTGIVGNVNTSTRTIQIDRRSGASVTRISVLPTTTIRSAAGATLALSGIRTSDRIVARGSLNDQRDALVATEITVSQAVPGAAPSG
jgi:hypothetical protein